jgi:hypothetical protein
VLVWLGLGHPEGSPDELVPAKLGIHSRVELSRAMAACEGH